MTINRRDFLKAMLATAAAPAIVKLSSIMPVVQLSDGLILWGDGIHDDTRAIQALLDGGRIVRSSDGILIPNGYIYGGDFLISETVNISSGNVISGSNFKIKGNVDPYINIPATCKDSLLKFNMFTG